MILTDLCAKKGEEEDSFLKKLAIVADRSKNVLPAFCGLYGACGAAIGCGIAMSDFTGTTPLSKETRSLCNYATAGSLQKMADMGGPRCCKRNSFAALLYMKKYIAENLGVEIDLPDEIHCSYSKFNLECIKEECPYYEIAE